MVKLQLVCEPKMLASYSGRTMCAHICVEFPALCASLVPASTNFCNQHSVDMEEDAEQPRNAELAGMEAPNLLVCEWYPSCLRMLAMFGETMPIISYYAGAPWNSYTLRAGQET